ncbi:sugar ABC transporter permease [Bacillus toyonensis]|uniref:carbohydrate ABC transporter permease n=1 Tax=Bacillus toyonensis TaxID=155322 RepID=UPI002E1B3439|nr:sugar ABC transporter permease [Bacillus toyonensis]
MKEVINLETTQKARSHSTIAALLSGVWMGLGQLYNRQYLKGLFFILSELYLMLFWIPTLRHAMWGLITLGEQTQKRVGFDTIAGDHSIYLMIEGFIGLIAIGIILFVYVMNVRDAYKVGKKRELGIEPNNLKQTYKNIIENGFAYLLLSPSILFVLFLVLLPNIFSIAIGFTNYSAPNHIPPKNLVDWVGFDSFISLFQLATWKDTFIGVFGWTVLWGILATVTTFFSGLFFAVILNQKGIRLKKFWRSIFILPWAVPQFVSILIFRNMFNGQFGPINQFLMDLGVISSNIPWLSDPLMSKITLVLVNMWFGFPFWMVLMSGVMTSIDKELYEAADVDGANAKQKFFKITLPIVLFSTAPLLIMQFAFNFNNFNVIYLLTEGGPANPDYIYAGHTDILISWIYKLTLDQSQFAMASVVSILIFIVVATISVWNFRRTKAFKEEDMMS